MNSLNQIKKKMTTDQFQTRPNQHQWSVDEIFRHMIANEIRYLQMPIDKTIEQSKIAVKAQWVGNILFRFEETTHVSFDDIENHFNLIEERSQKIFDSLKDGDLNKLVKAPWGEDITYKEMIEDLINHTEFHRGQIHYVSTMILGFDHFVKPSENKNYG